ncbi:glyoxalase/bleomycin resistance/dioxygenase family protein [Ktedonosporobacter rubrisoli]|uniref:Glyoxalase/bleomycin resistance/dioxygenase family protein n=1 Tax=Ktedonosporobacter rubrisoli TaxID=2509675 RepID=A0A4P6JYP9_KTERU|nr:VOC family protein [Ktedonosporobacter rubrisoli]QBD80622.1 glyoxalase/bleomycin resistance/dioxygenase family protein [Ktedonosporobacter rubrisoli]
MLKAIRNLDYTIILCQDVAAMKRFYHELLGFPLYRDFGNWVELQVGASLLTLRERGAGYDGVREHDGPAPQDGTSALQLAFRVTPAEVDSCFSELRQKDVTILLPPTNQASGHRTLFFKDPENNVLEIYADL